MRKCNCYQSKTERHYFTDFEQGFNAAKGIYDKYEDRIVAYCSGTSECELCSCGGDRCKCDFYEDVRKEAKIEYVKEQKERSQKALTNKEREELMFYRQWIRDHDLQFELINDFEKWKKLR